MNKRAHNALKRSIVLLAWLCLMAPSLAARRKAANAGSPIKSGMTDAKSGKAVTEAAPKNVENPAEQQAGTSQTASPDDSPTGEKKPMTTSTHNALDARSESGKTGPPGMQENTETTTSPAVTKAPVEMPVFKSTFPFKSSMPPAGVSPHAPAGFVQQQASHVPHVPGHPERDPDLFTITPEETKDITLNFENAELKSFIDYVADQRNMMIIPDKKVAGNKISINFRNPVSKTGAWNALLAVMDVAGFAMVKEFLDEGQVLYKVVPKDKKLRQPLPTFIGVKSDDLPKNDATIRYVKFLSNISTQEIKPLISNFLSNPHGLLEQPNVNALIITDKASVIRSVMEVVDELDQTSIQESVFVLRLKRANARDVKALFDSLIKKEGGNNPLARLLGKRKEQTAEYFSSGTKLIAEERTNSLVMLGNRKSIDKVRNFITQHIDTELRQAESPLRIYELQHTNAEEMKAILEEVVSSSNMQSEAGQQAAKTGAVRGGVKYFKAMRFQAEKEGNRLIVSCADNNDWELLKQTIRELDRPQPQVAIQMMIVTVTSKSLRELGGQFRNKHHGQFGKNIDFQSTPISSSNTFEKTGSSVVSLLGSLVQGLAGGQGSTLFSIGKIIGDVGSGNGGLWAVFKALKSETDATVLSQPFLVTTNRTRGNLHFGETKWIDAQKAVGNDGNIGGAAGKKEVSAATDISILPQINLDGIIKLDVDIKVNEFVDTAGEVTQEKNLKTNVTVGNGQVLALGGFVKTKVSESGGKTPIWSDIPLLGWLGKNKSRSEDKEYVFMFLSPTILKPRTQPGVEPFTKIKLHQATRDVESGTDKKDRDPIHKWFFVTDKNTYAHKVTDFANARYQPTNVDLKNDPFYRSETKAEHNKRLHITDEAHSPQAYIKAYKQRKKAAQLLQEAAEKVQGNAGLPGLPASRSLKQAGTTAPTKQSVAWDPGLRRDDVKSARPVTVAQIAKKTPQTHPTPSVPTYNTAPIIHPAQQTKVQPTPPVFASPVPVAQPVQQAPAPKASAQTNITDPLEQRRAQLRDLLSSSSLLELLGNAPKEDVGDGPPIASGMTQGTSKAIEGNVMDARSESDMTGQLMRRRGLKSFLQETPEPESAQLHSAAGRKSLASFFATPGKE